MQGNEARIDVLVIGAGPVGLTAAIEARRRNLRVRIVDVKDAPANTSRALGTHALTLEVYAAMGVLDRILAHSQKLHNFTVHSAGKRLTTFGYDFGTLSPLIASSAFIGQADTERILRERLSELGVDVEWNIGLTGVQHSDNVIRATLASKSNPGNEEETLRVPWLIAADGGHSTVRKLLDLPFEGSSDETWIVTDAQVASNLPRNSIHMVRHHEGNLLMFPFPTEGKWRILETRPPAEGAEKDTGALIATFNQRLSEGTGHTVEVNALTWVSRFTIQQRQVAELRKGRIFLAGDAAHVHSPASGQGMNVGIQDAFNLVWKIARVHQGQASDALLDTYSAERRPVSTNLLKSAKIATRAIQSRQGATYALSGWMMAFQDALKPLHRKIEKRITAQLSGLTVKYGDPSDAAGSRFPVFSPAVRASEEGKRLTAWFLGPELKLLLVGASSDNLLAVAKTINNKGISVCSTSDPGIVADLGCQRSTVNGWIVRPDGYLLAELSPFAPEGLEKALSAL